MGTTQQIPDVDDRNDKDIPGQNSGWKKSSPTRNWEMCQVSSKLYQGEFCCGTSL